MGRKAVAVVAAVLVATFAHGPAAGQLGQRAFDEGAGYYWRVEGNAADGTATTGYMLISQDTPATAWAPDPPDGAVYVKTSPTLTWAAGQSALSHDVYVGTKRDDVVKGLASTFKGNQKAPTLKLKALLPNTTYYWGVDEIGAAGKHIGAIWQFTTRPAISITDPNLVAWWSFDEGFGTTAVDWSGHENDGTLRGNPQWVSGCSGSALKFDGVRDYVEVPHSATLIVTQELTVMAWINAARHTGPGGVEWQGILAKGNTIRSYSLYTQTGGTLYFSITSGGVYVGSSSTGTVPLNEWAHVAATIKGGTQEFFINGRSAGEGGSDITPPGAAGTDAVWIGATQEGPREFQGMIDEARIYNVGLTQEQVKKAMQGDLTLASNPQPGLNADVDIRVAEALRWSAGEKAARHDVYFGRDHGAVSTADPTSPSYQGRQTGTDFPLEGLVEFGGGSYFWRIDEVEVDGVTIHRGAVWSFTVPSYLIIDEFEAYDDVEGSRIFDVWVDGYADGLSGSAVGHGMATQGTFGERTIVHGGHQSMPMDFNNTTRPYYSEAVRTFTPPEDWTAYGVTNLSLWFLGQPIPFVDTGNVTGRGQQVWIGNAPDRTNDAAGLYVAVEDDAGKSGMATYPDSAATNFGVWTEWRIPLSSLTGVNLAKIKKLYIGVGDRKNPVPDGSGRIYLDDIRVIKP